MPLGVWRFFMPAGFGFRCAPSLKALSLQRLFFSGFQFRLDIGDLRI